MNHQDTKNQDTANMLRIAGGAMIALGVFAGLYLLYRFSQPGLFSRGGLSPQGLLIVIAVIAYHIVWAMPCFGIAQILSGSASIGYNPPVRAARAPVEPIISICPKCNMTYDGDLTGKFCDNCGAALELDEDVFVRNLRASL